MIEGFKDADAKSIVRQVNQGQQDEWAISKDDIAALQDFIKTENDLMKEVAYLQVTLTDISNKAIKARADRDGFCKTLEGKLGVPPGTSWKVDLDKGLLIKNK